MHMNKSCALLLICISFGVVIRLSRGKEITSEWHVSLVQVSRIVVPLRADSVPLFPCSCFTPYHCLPYFLLDQSAPCHHIRCTSLSVAYHLDSFFPEKSWPLLISRQFRWKPWQGNNEGLWSIGLFQECNVCQFEAAGWGQGGLCDFRPRIEEQTLFVVWSL